MKFKDLKQETRKARTLSESIPSDVMRLSGIVKTTNGFCVATCELTKDGQLQNLVLGKSQRLPEFVAIEHRPIAGRLAQRAIHGRES